MKVLGFHVPGTGTKDEAGVVSALGAALRLDLAYFSLGAATSEAGSEQGQSPSSSSDENKVQPAQPASPQSETETASIATLELEHTVTPAAAKEPPPAVEPKAQATPVVEKKPKFEFNMNRELEYLLTTFIEVEHALADQKSNADNKLAQKKRLQGSLDWFQNKNLSQEQLTVLQKHPVYTALETLNKGELATANASINDWLKTDEGKEIVKNRKNYSDTIDINEQNTKLLEKQKALLAMLEARIKTIDTETANREQKKLRESAVNDKTQTPATRIDKPSVWKNPQQATTPVDTQKFPSIEETLKKYVQKNTIKPKKEPVTQTKPVHQTGAKKRKNGETYVLGATPYKPNKNTVTPEMVEKKNLDAAQKAKKIKEARKAKVERKAQRAQNLKEQQQHGSGIVESTGTNDTLQATPNTPKAPATPATKPVDVLKTTPTITTRIDKSSPWKNVTPQQATPTVDTQKFPSIEEALKKDVQKNTIKPKKEPVTQTGAKKRKNGETYVLGATPYKPNKNTVTPEMVEQEKLDAAQKAEEIKEVPPPITTANPPASPSNSNEENTQQISAPPPIATVVPPVPSATENPPAPATPASTADRGSPVGAPTGAQAIPKIESGAPQPMAPTIATTEVPPPITTAEPPALGTGFENYSPQKTDIQNNILAAMEKACNSVSNWGSPFGKLKESANTKKDELTKLKNQYKNASDGEDKTTALAEFIAKAAERRDTATGKTINDPAPATGSFTAKQGETKSLTAFVNALSKLALNEVTKQFDVDRPTGNAAKLKRTLGMTTDLGKELATQAQKKLSTSNPNQNQNPKR